ncbi:snaclec agglucetin subunit beta-2-like [Ruditapes philippinarum]|uniref:snaclec agglucetin subunit beta-2-like n=1 Tax=Ruditapes philippinarum TaxID=129788 RepID=UPI00295B3D58|nr:snaclec agglucetin subunit beta-2-like [Ruditapes philippinarum]
MSSFTMGPNKEVFHMLPIFISFLCIGGISAGTLCPDNWTAFRGSCYLSPRYNLSFHDAERFCEHLGGYLVEVDDATENAFLKSY